MVIIFSFAFSHLHNTHMPREWNTNRIRLYHLPAFNSPLLEQDQILCHCIAMRICLLMVPGNAHKWWLAFKKKKGGGGAPWLLGHPGCMYPTVLSQTPLALGWE